MLNLDYLDRHLLFELDTNSRQSYQQLAKKLKTSKDTIKYRIERMKSKWCIKSYNAVIDTGKLGLISFRLFLRFHSISPQKEQELLKILSENKNITFLAQVESRGDINTHLMFKTITEMGEMWNYVIEHYNNYLQEKEFGVYLNSTYFSRAYLLKKKYNTTMMNPVSLQKHIKIDKLDLELIELLAKNCRASLLEIAAKVKSTTKTVLKRI